MNKHLSSWKNPNILDTWHQGKVVPGANYEEEIEKRLKNSEIIIFLINADFLDNADCMRQATLELEHHDREHTVVVPLIVRHVVWRNSPIGRLEPLLPDERPVEAWSDPDEAYSMIAKKLVEKCSMEISSLYATISLRDAELLEISSRGERCYTSDDWKRSLSNEACSISKT